MRCIFWEGSGMFLEGYGWDCVDIWGLELIDMAFWKVGISFLRDEGIK